MFFSDFSEREQTDKCSRKFPLQDNELGKAHVIIMKVQANIIHAFCWAT